MKDTQLFIQYIQNSYDSLLLEARKYMNILNKHSLECSDLVAIAQEKAWKNFHKFDGNEKKFRSWISTIMHNSAINLYRKKKPKSIDINEISYKLEESENTENVFKRENSFDYIVSLFPPKNQVVLKLFFQEGYKIEEIADLLDIPSGTVKSRIYRNFPNIKEILQKQEGQWDR